MFSVTVPVLSTQSTSTRARVSMQPISWTRVFFWASRTTPATSAMLVSRYRPSGIMPMREATVAMTPSATSRPSQTISLTAIRAPRGMTATPIIFTSLVRERIISLSFGGLDIFASMVRRLA